MDRHRSSLWCFLEPFLPWLGLSILLIYSYAYFVLNQNPGFSYNASDGIVWRVTSPDLKGVIQPGDKLEQIGPLTWNTIRQNKLSAFANTHPGDPVDLVVARNGQTIRVTYPMPRPTRQDFFEKLNSQWFLPYIFWLSGAASLYFVRPKDDLRKVLALFSFLTAGWISAGILSSYRLLGSPLMMRSLIWLWMPVTLHLHWLFPVPLTKFPKGLFLPIYAVGLTLAVAEWVAPVPSNLYYAGFLIALTGSLVLLIAHSIRQRSERAGLTKLLFAFGLTLIPLVSTAILGLFNVSPWFNGAAILGISAFPGFYFYSIFQRQMTGRHERVSRLVNQFIGLVVAGTLFFFAISLLMGQFQGVAYSSGLSFLASISLALIGLAGFAPFLILPALANQEIHLNEKPSGPRLSANRAAALMMFAVLWLPGATLLHLVFVLLFPYFSGNVIEAVGISLIVAITSSLTFPAFVRFFDHKILGMPSVPETLIQTYAERIATRFNRHELSALLAEQVLPTLLVRQSALVHFSPETDSEWVLVYGLAPGQLPNDAVLSNLRDLARHPGDFEQILRSFPDSPDWARAALPLRANGDVYGIWWLGQRDPDDQYSQEDLIRLSVLATQTAVALVNIQQASALHRLYAANVREREMERGRLARELHDTALNQIATMNIFIDETQQPQVTQALADLAQYLRQTVNDLRPPILNYGLAIAIQQLAEDLQDRSAPRPEILVNLTGGDARFPDEVEQQFFRILQQAVENALRHAQAAHLTICAKIDPAALTISVEDDGIGFDCAKGMDLSGLLYRRHYGLVGMFERAAMISADFRIDSQPGYGTRVLLAWPAHPDLPPSGSPQQMSLNGK
jgi:signal transduction histidine kinase